MGALLEFDRTEAAVEATATAHDLSSARHGNTGFLGEIRSCAALWRSKRLAGWLNGLVLEADR